MEFKKDFEDLLTLAKNCDQTYIGHGNPNSNILIVANEPGTVSKDLIENDLNLNRTRWEKNLNDPREMSELEDVFGNGDFWGRFNPLWPFKGQHFVQERKKTISPDRVVVLNEAKHPTSRSWYQYQKLVDMICNEDPICLKHSCDSIDFFERAFITDFSAVYGLHSHEISREARFASIMKRLPLFGSPFFCHFPVIIVASGHYIHNIDLLNDLTKVFPGFSTNRIELITSNPGWRNVHTSDDGKRILIHTKHFASAISDPYLTAIALKCREVLNAQ